MPTLEFLNGPLRGTHMPIVGERFALGRSRKCKGFIDEKPVEGGPTVSRDHAILTRSGGRWFIEDGDGHGTASHNGTRLNGHPVPHPTRVPVSPNDEITIGKFRLAFRADPDSTFSALDSVSHTDSRRALEAQSAERLRALLDASESLRGTLDSKAIFDRVLDHLLRMFPQVQRGLIICGNDPTEPLTLCAARYRDGIAADPRFSTRLIRRCMEGVEAILGNDLSTQFPDVQSITGIGVRSLMCAPLWSHDGHAVGAIQLDTHASGRKFTPDDLRLLLGVAGQASVALGNARMHREALSHQRRARDLELARHVQRALLPSALPALRGYDFFALYLAAEAVGGDYYDFVPLPGGRLAVLLGDVAGHGVAAALVMARLSAEARACLESERDVGAAITRLNGMVVRANVPGNYVTLAAMVLDPVAHTVTAVSAGHPPPLIRRSTGIVEGLMSADDTGMVLGVMDGMEYESRHVCLNPGDTVLLFSDGLPEAMDQDDRPLGMASVRALFGAADPTPRKTSEGLSAAVQRHTSGCAQADDITLVCFARAGE